MSQYNFFTLKQNKNADLPEDVNEQCEKSADMFKDPSLKESLINARKKKLFVKVEKTGILNGINMVLAEYKFQYGMCPQYSLARAVSSSVIETRTILNSKCDFKKL